MNLNALLLIHAVITLLAGLVLILAPNLIPNTVNISLSSEQYLLSYFLGAAEIALAYLSFTARSLNDDHARNLIVTTFIIFHLLTGLLEIYSLSNGVNPKIVANILVRFVAAALFYFFGVYSLSKQK